MKETNIFDNVCRYTRKKGLSIYGSKLFKKNKNIDKGSFLYKCINYTENWKELCRSLLMFNTLKSAGVCFNQQEMYRTNVLKYAVKEAQYNALYEDIPLQIALLMLPVKEQNIFCIQVLMQKIECVDTSCINTECCKVLSEFLQQGNKSKLDYIKEKLNAY